MQEHHRKKAAFALLAGGLWFGSATLIAKNDEGGNTNKSKSSTQSESRGSSKKVNLTDYEAPSATKGTTNASLHRAASQEVVTSLEQVAEGISETKGNSGVGKANGNKGMTSAETGLGKKDELTTTTPATGKPSSKMVLDPVKSAEVQEVVETVATEVAETSEETTAAIEAVETRGKVKTLLVGTDYENLGQLRSSLVHNRNDIRKLTEALALAQTEEEKAAIQLSLDELMGERTRIKEVITDNEAAFSLFGWVSRFLTNYEMTPINTEEEEELETEVEEAIENVEEETETPTGTPTETTPETPIGTPTETTPAVTPTP